MSCPFVTTSRLPCVDKNAGWGVTAEGCVGVAFVLAVPCPPPPGALALVAGLTLSRSAGLTRGFDPRKLAAWSSRGGPPRLLQRAPRLAVRPRPRGGGRGAKVPTAVH